MVSKKDGELPPLWLSVIVMILPAILTATASFFSRVPEKNLTGILPQFGGGTSYNALNPFIVFHGNKVICWSLWMHVLFKGYAPVNSNESN
ncbi:MAG TPA: hypothetical protein EYQ50_25485 [Verrucomicrobiales bacterium]|jgi:hypothetical protein|nr:hypothetical protein [Verrucomicrobiales bacterium]